MKVKELIDRLKEWDEETEVEVLAEYNVYRGQIKEITKPIDDVYLGKFCLIIETD